MTLVIVIQFVCLFFAVTVFKRIRRMHRSVTVALKGHFDVGIPKRKTTRNIEMSLHSHGSSVNNILIIFFLTVFQFFFLGNINIINMIISESLGGGGGGSLHLSYTVNVVFLLL